MKKKTVCISICILLIIVALPTSGIIVEKSSISTFIGKTLYVGRIGPGNYTSIQDLIDNASDGDTIYIPSGTYYENIIINKSINLIGEDKNTTVIDGSGSRDVVYVSADWVNLSGFTIQNGSKGINISSNFNTITGNTISINNYVGIYLEYSFNNIITYNNIKLNVEEGIYLYHSSGNTIIGNNIFRSGTGIYLHYDSDNNTLTGNTINSNKESGVDIISSSNNTITGNTINLNNDDGIYLYYSSTNTITGNTISLNNEDGIHLYYSSTNTIKGNNISLNNEHGIWLKGSDSNTITSNNIISNNWDGIGLRYSSTNTITSNNITSNNDDGIELYWSSSNTITGNTIILNNGDGIRLRYECESNTITGNTIILNNWSGIYLKYSSSNNITGNTITSNKNEGIELHGSSNKNTIYHNNFINNGGNAYDEGDCIWDDGYPSGGNFWDDYNGTDADGDGIGDTPYDIPGGDNEDRYPLMFPYDDKEPPKVKITKPVKALYFFNLKLRPYLFRKPLIIGSIDIEVDASDDLAINYVEFYIDDENRYNDTTEPYSWTWKRREFIRHRFTITVVTYDYAGNHASDKLVVWRFF